MFLILGSKESIAEPYNLKNAIRQALNAATLPKEGDQVKTEDIKEAVNQAIDNKTSTEKVKQDNSKEDNLKKRSNL